jgi:hypothetical protein
MVGITAVTALRIADADAAFAEQFTDALREQVEQAQADREPKAEPLVEPVERGS